MTALLARLHAASGVSRQRADRFLIVVRLLSGILPGGHRRGRRGGEFRVCHWAGPEDIEPRPAASHDPIGSTLSFAAEVTAVGQGERGAPGRCARLGR